jgi:hypothetical protein
VAGLCMCGIQGVSASKAPVNFRIVFQRVVNQ